MYMHLQHNLMFILWCYSYALYIPTTNDTIVNVLFVLFICVFQYILIWLFEFESEVYVRNINVKFLQTSAYNTNIIQRKCKLDVCWSQLMRDFFQVVSINLS